MTICTFFAGSYTLDSDIGINLIEFNYDDKSLKVITSQKSSNASYLVISKNKKIVYCVNENDYTSGEFGGQVSSFLINDNKTLKHISTQFTKGQAPCHLGLNSSETHLFVANYSSGSVSVFPVTEQGEILPACNMMINIGSNNAHAHYVKEIPYSKKIILSDLGLDKVIIYKYKNNYSTFELLYEIDIAPGSGPRHLVFKDEHNLLYVVMELTSEVYFYKYIDKQYKFMQKISTVNSSKKNSCAAIHFSKCKNYLLVSNRGDDSIAVFKLDVDGLMSLVNIFDVGCKNPRDFLFDPTGKYIFVAGKDSDIINVFNFDDQTGYMHKQHTSINIKKPVCITMLETK